MRIHGRNKTEPLHLICQLHPTSLRAWKKRSLRGEVWVAGRIRPQAYSSFSTIFRGFLEPWRRAQEAPAVIWIMTSYRAPGESQRRPSIVAKMVVRRVYGGTDDSLPDALRRYIAEWSGSGANLPPERCTIVQADASRSRFFPVNDATSCLAALHFMNKDGAQTEYSPRRPMCVAPNTVSTLEAYADTVASRTVFISYKHRDFQKTSSCQRPPWKPRDLAETLIRGGYGVWLDTLCAPRQREDSNTDLNAEEVAMLLAEGHLQSRVLIAVDTENYLTLGLDGRNWTEAEYRDAVSSAKRETPLLRLLVQGAPGIDRRPQPDCVVRWDVTPLTEMLHRLDDLMEKRTFCATSRTSRRTKVL